MNSHPSASATIFLDFDGHLVQGTSWNSMGAIECGPANLDASKISEVFHRVAEDYRPFNVNVTTDSTKYWAAPSTRRIRLVVTVSSAWFGSNAGGVAYMGSFTWGDNSPAFVFSALLGYNAKNIAEAASHEIGHTLGLRHQAAYDGNCHKISDYHTGIGSGETGWAPIMGVGYYRNFTLWNSGANPLGCTNIQNDLEIITNYNGFGYRSDDYGSHFPSASSATFSNNSFLINGIIERNTDVDVIKFNMPSFGRFQLSALPFSVGSGNTGSNLDLQVELMTNQNTVISTYNPEDILAVSIDTMLSAGTYYLRMQGKGNSYASEYASLGSYKLEATFSNAPVLPLHKFSLTGKNINSWHQLNWEIIADETVVKQTIEVSANGNTFKPLAFPGAEERSYSWIPAATGNIFYRVKSEFDDGRTFYSNIINLKNDAASKPQLQSNIVTSRLLVSGGAGYDFHIVDINGRIFRKGSIESGQQQIEVSGLPAGMYLVHFYSSNMVFAEKFLKQ